MRLKFRTEGGFASFPGLRAPVEIDTGELQEEEATELVRCVEEARFFQRPEGPEEPPPGSADLRLYTVEVEEGAWSHTVRVYEPVGDPALRALIDALDARAKALRRARRKQGSKGDR
ncbi:MAG: hypothetical protein M3P37_12460 [Actinomycetota bacterium]|nr:hypothetical protein [Actinomycetota bacterium]